MILLRGSPPEKISALLNYDAAQSEKITGIIKEIISECEGDFTTLPIDDRARKYRRAA